MSSLVQHAEREIQIAGLFDKDSDYNGETGKNLMELVKVFAAQRHSGGSAAIVIKLLDKLLRFENITPLKYDASEWMDVSEMSGKPMWQNKRNTAVFSEDEGETCYNVNDIDRDRD